MIKINLSGLGRILLVNAGIVVLSASVGISLNRAFVAGPQESVFSYSNEGGKVEFKPVPASQVEPAEVQLSDVRQIVASKSMVLVDGRSQSEYENGHLPGAFSLSVADFDKRFPRIRRSIPEGRRLPDLLWQRSMRSVQAAGWSLEEKGIPTHKALFGRVQ